MTSTADPPPAASGNQAVRQTLSHPDEAGLAYMRRHWGDAYEITCPDGEWTASFRGETDVLTASTAAELEALICQDHSDRRTGASMGQGERALRQLGDDGVI